MRKIIFLIIVVAILYFSWVYLPEKLYLMIAGLSNVKIISAQDTDIPNQKFILILAVAFGFSFLLHKSFEVIRNSIPKLLIATALILVSLFVGVFLCFHFFQYDVGLDKFIRIKNCFNIFIILPVIAIFLFGLKYLSVRLSRRQI